MSEIRKIMDGSNPIVKLQREVQNLFSNFGGDLFSNFSGDWYNHSPTHLEEKSLLSPKVNLSETPNHFNVMLELPGVEKDHIHITRDQHLLTVTAEKKHTRKEEQENFYHVECGYGTVTRSIKLPANIKDGEISAEFINGVLYITLPKQPVDENTKHHRIIIK